MEPGILNDLAIIFGVSAVSVFVLNRLKVPTLVGFIIAGVLIGPSGLALIHDVHDIEAIAEIGVILLLFTIGIEFSLSKLLRIRNTVLIAGGGQVLITIALTAALTYPFAGNTGIAVFFGFITAMSSTAIVLKSLMERGEADSSHGRMMLGVLIFQDLCVVPLMLITQSIGAGEMNLAAMAFMMLKAGAIIVLVLLSARWIVPTVLHHVVSSKSRELFLITVILICLGTALLTSRFGLSLALGAFLAGLVISESEYAYQATADILPFKDSFIGMFFVSVGMLVDVSFIYANPLQVFGSVLFILVVKTAASALPLYLHSGHLKPSVHSGMGLAQIGEFSFILAEAGKASGLMTEGLFQTFLSASVITMVLTPYMHRAAPAISRAVSTSFLGRLLHDRAEETEETRKLSGHIIIVGFGLNGRNLAFTLREAGLKYVVLELNSSTVKKERLKGEPIFFGEGTSMEVLHKLGLHRARTLVITIPDPTAVRKIVALVRRDNPDIHIIVRTRYVAEIDGLAALGADEVIPEEFETSVEIFARVLNYYNVPRNVINDQIESIRNNAYHVLRTHEIRGRRAVERHDMLSAIETVTYLVRKGSPLDGHTLSDADLRGQTGATVLAMERGKGIIQNPSPGLALAEGDILLIMGQREQLSRAVEYLENFVIEEPYADDSSHFDLP